MSLHQETLLCAPMPLHVLIPLPEMLSPPHCFKAMSSGPTVFEEASPPPPPHPASSSSLADRTPPKCFQQPGTPYRSVLLLNRRSLTLLDHCPQDRIVRKAWSAVLVYTCKKNIIQKLIRLVEKHIRCCSKGRGQENVVTGFWRSKQSLHPDGVWISHGECRRGSS